MNSYRLYLGVNGKRGKKKYVMNDMNPAEFTSIDEIVDFLSDYRKISALRHMAETFKWNVSVERDNEPVVVDNPKLQETLDYINAKGYEPVFVVH